MTDQWVWAGLTSNPGLDFFVVKDTVIVLISSVEIRRDGLEEFIHGDPPVFLSLIHI